MVQQSIESPSFCTAIDTENIPKELREHDQWVLWRIETRDGKSTKVPYKAKGRGHAKADDPKTWSPFAVTIGAALRLGGTYGIGFVFSAEDPYVGIDLDKCRDSETGTLEPWARDIVDELASYTEISPSGRGLHIIIKAKLPPDGRRKGPLEMYEEGRYFTITGARLEGTHATVELRQSEVERLHTRTFQPPPELNTNKTDGVLDLADEDLLAKAFASKNGAKFNALWTGQIEAYGSQSEADLALCRLLAFWTNGNTARMDHLFRRSSLMREKWDQNSGAGRSYGDRTITKALEGFTEGYTGERSRSRRTTRRPEVQGHGAGSHRTELAALEMVANYRLTEGGNAERFADRHHEVVRFVPDLNAWFVWDNKRWARDDLSKIDLLGRELVLELYREAADESDEEVRKALVRHAFRSDRLGAIRNMAALAASDPRLAAKAGWFDKDPWLLNVDNGTLDLRAGALRSHCREDMLTKLAPIPYDPQARCPLWLAFLERIFASKKDLLGFVQRALGYSLTGDTSERVLFFLHGSGKNGKSKLLEAFRSVVGEPEDGGYAMRTPTETLMIRRGSSIPNDIARLKGTRFVTASETEEDSRLAESLIKDMTGEDTISARFMRAEWFDFKPTHKIWLSTNHKPVIRGTDQGIWDRIRLIPFNVRIPDEEQDKRLGEKLRGEREGILAWAVEGLKDWLKHGLGEPLEVTEATASYRAEMDILALFITDCCIENARALVGAKELYEAYEAWCESNGEKAITKKKFGLRLRERGLNQERTESRRLWSGIGLLGT